MNKKDILELKRRFKKTQCTFTKLCGCYVNSEKEIVTEFRETFLNLPDEELHKYLEITKKVLSGGIGNNLLGLEFPLDENYYNEKQSSLMLLQKSALKDDTIVRGFYKSIIENFDYGENYLILLFHDVYDVMVKTSDKMKLDESEEMYEYIVCAICPVKLSKAGLGYFESDNKIAARIRDWVVDPPRLGFVFPGFVDRSSDINTLMYYTKNAKEPHPELMEDTFGCRTKQTATMQKETFETLIKSSVPSDEDLVEKVFEDIQENLSAMIEEHEELYEGTEANTVVLSKDKVKDLLIESGVSEEVTARIENTYVEVFGDEEPLAESLIDKKILKANAQKKVEKELMERVESLESKLQAAVGINREEQTPDVAGESLEDTFTQVVEDPEEEIQESFDVVLHVNPSKLSKIKTEIIDGQRCIVVPIDENEQAKINGIEDLI